jgi:Rod binding domain-containing protein
MEPIQPSKSSIAYQPTTLGGTSDLGRLANHPHLKEEEKMEAVAKEFEVMLVKQVLKSAQQPLTESGSTFFPTQGTGAIYGDMMIDTLSGSVGRAGQLGLARLFQQQLSLLTVEEINTDKGPETDSKST